MPDADAPSLTLERFAAVSALIDAGMPRDEVLSEAGLSKDAWAREQTAWLNAMSQQARMRRFALQDRFNTQLVAYLDALEAGDELEVADGRKLGCGKGKDQKPEKKASAAASPKVAPIEVAPQANIKTVPEPPRMIFGAPPPAPPAMPKPPAAAPPAAAPPAAAPRAAAPPASSWLDAAPSSQTLEPPPSSTLPDMKGDPRVAVLPFVAASPNAAPPRAGVLMVSDPVRTGETYDDPPPNQARGQTIPFQKVPTPGAANQTAPAAQIESAGLPFRSTPKAAAPPAAVPKYTAPEGLPKSPVRPKSEGAMDLSQTLSADGPLPDATLPFKETAPGPKKRAPRDGATPFAGVKPPSPPKINRHDPLAGTMMLDSPRNMGSTATKLTLEQFASLTAEIALEPARRAEIEKRYGFDAASHDREKHGWAHRFVDDPKLVAQYQQKLAEFKAWLAKHRT